MSEAKLQVTECSVFYGQTEAIKQVSMGFPTNRVTALIGPSGCGKSTLLRALNRMLDTIAGARVEGKVLLDGEDVYAGHVDAVEVRRRVGMVFQKSNPFPKSIFENVAFGLRIAGEKRNDVLEKAVKRSLEAAALWDEVSDRLDQSALGLSGGQQQRLCIARALAVEPEVLLMDEPASALDPVATERIEELIEDLKRHLTIVIVTHSMSQARRVSDYTGFFYLGELIEHGETEGLFEQPREEKTRAYVTGRFG